MSTECKDQAFDDLKADAFFSDLREDLHEFCGVFSRNNLIQEQPEFYAAAAMTELLDTIKSVFDSKGTMEGVDTVFSEWFTSHFTSDRLNLLKKLKLIEQIQGFTVCTLVNFECAVLEWETHNA